MNNLNAFANWENAVIDLVETLCECNRSDAQSIAGAQEFILQNNWNKEINPATTAHQIVHAATPSETDKNNIMTIEELVTRIEQNPSYHPESVLNTCAAWRAKQADDLAHTMEPEPTDAGPQTVLFPRPKVDRTVTAQGTSYQTTLF